MIILLLLCDFASLVRNTSKSQSGSNASTSTLGASAITSERSSSTNPTPSPDCQSAEGTSKGQEKPKSASQVAAKIGKSDTNKAKKRPSDTPGPSSVKVSWIR